jgi:hypothetical protein
MEGWGPDRHNGRGPAWPAPQRSVVLVSSILQTLLPFKAPGNGQFLPTRKCQPAAQFIDNSKLSLLTRSPRFFQRGYYCNGDGLLSHAVRQLNERIRFFGEA